MPKSKLNIPMFGNSPAVGDNNSLVLSHEQVVHLSSIVSSSTILNLVIVEYSFTFRVETIGDP